MSKINRSFAWLLLLPVLVWCFSPGFVEMKTIYTSFWLRENAIVAVIVVSIFSVVAFRFGRGADSKDSYWLIFFGFVVSCLGLVLNNILGGFQIVPPILVYIALYSWIGMFLVPQFWRRSTFVLILLILTLPVLERVQKFVGFPIRVLTAQVVSVLLRLMGTGNVSQSTVILTENYATTIDLPCSGVKSLYFGLIFLVVSSFIQQVRLSLKSVLIAVTFFLLLIFFNIWRVFGLVYVYGVLRLSEAGDMIHLFLGIFGFVASCVFLWFANEYFVQKKSPAFFSFFKLSSFSLLYSKKLPSLHFNQLLMLCSFVFVVTAIATKHVFTIAYHSEIIPDQEMINFSFPGSTLHVIPFSDKEQTLFFHKEVTFASKYSLVWQEEKQLSLLLVKSSSARVHHDPELCLQGLGYQLTEISAVSVDDQSVNSLQIKTANSAHADSAQVYYWYTSRDQVIADYSQRVWSSMQHPDQDWVLVEVIVRESDHLTTEELQTLFRQLNDAVRFTMF